MSDEQRVTTERRGHILLIGLNRPEKRNAFDTTMLAELAQAYTVLEQDSELRCGVLFAHGDHFTAGLDLAQVGPAIARGERTVADGQIDPMGLSGARRETPVVAAAQGLVLTLGIELLLAADVRLAAADARFAQIEVGRGIYPIGGATVRFVREAGWGNAMRWMLTGEQFGADEALRMGLVQEVVEPGHHLARAVALAERIAAQAPLGIRATMRSAHLALREGEQAAFDRLRPDVQVLFKSEDAAEGIRSFMERRPANFSGR